MAVTSSKRIERCGESSQQHGSIIQAEPPGRSRLLALAGSRQTPAGGLMRWSPPHPVRARL
ncbi:hypothetical protein D0A22_21255 [Stutzerimonas stutzeri]|nr:hypothetical protein D0A22_21255 [Stutzerimonas stutzeri]